MLPGGARDVLGRVGLEEGRLAQAEGVNVHGDAAGKAAPVFAAPGGGGGGGALVLNTDPGFQ